MKISNSTSYPHPVLAPWSDDIIGFGFQSQIAFRENEQRSQVSIHCHTQLDHPEIVSLIAQGRASFGCYIRCQDTGLRRVQPLGFPDGIHDFAPGAMLGRVYIRPMVWASTPIPHYAPAGAHPEFGAESSLQPGDLIALGEVLAMDVTRPPLPPLESIFEIRLSEDVAEGEFDIDTGLNRVTVSMAKDTYELVQGLRQTDDHSRAAVTNALYVPIIMEVLEQLRDSGPDQFSQHRWLNPFLARCDAIGVDLKKPRLLCDAQKLLDLPFASLHLLTGEANT